MSVSGPIQVSLRVDHTSALDLCTPSETVIDVANFLSWTIADGTGADQADLVFHDQRTIAGSGSEDLDLAGGLTDAYGATLTFARIKAIQVKASSANAGQVWIDQSSASNPWVTFLGAGSDLRLEPGAGFIAISPDATGWPVTAGTGDILRLYNDNGAPAVYDIVLIGASA